MKSRYLFPKHLLWEPDRKWFPDYGIRPDASLWYSVPGLFWHLEKSAWRWKLRINNWNFKITTHWSNPIKLINFILNYINIGLFALLFAWFPLAEIKVFTYNGIHSYIGFIMHYFSLACVAFMAFKMYKVRTESNTPIANMKILNSILLITCIVYLCSIDLQ